MKELIFPWDVPFSELEKMSDDQLRSCNNCALRKNCYEHKKTCIDCCGEHLIEHGFEQLTLL